jgi:hypothetical protein
VCHFSTQSIRNFGNHGTPFKICMIFHPYTCVGCCQSTWNQSIWGSLLSVPWDYHGYLGILFSTHHTSQHVPRYAIISATHCYSRQMTTNPTMTPHPCSCMHWPQGMLMSWDDTHGKDMTNGPIGVLINPWLCLLVGWYHWSVGSYA